MNRESIIINSIEPVYLIKQWTGEEPTYKQVSLKVNFSYKKIIKAEIDIETSMIDVTYIKDKIMEVLG